MPGNTRSYTKTSRNDKMATDICTASSIYPELYCLSQKSESEVAQKIRVADDYCLEL